MQYWQDKVALVTGGSQGLGRAVAQAFAVAGAKVVISARDPERLAQTAQELRRHGGAVLATPADITRQDQVERLIESALAQFGRLDVLVNNAGRSARGQALDTSPDDFRELMELNFIAAVRCARAAVPHLLKTRGHLVNIGSLAGKTASRYVGAYPASKFALAAYTQQLRLELTPLGLHVLLVSPGPITRDQTTSRRADSNTGLPESSTGLPARAQSPGAGVRIRGIRPDKLARSILAACRRRQPELVVPAYVRLFLALTQLSPRLGDWLVRRWT